MRWRFSIAVITAVNRSDWLIWRQLGLTITLRAKSPLCGQRLSQRQLAKLIGTTASVICRLEDADYEGHSLAMLNRIAAALNRRVEINFVPAERRLRSA
jgi:hypothetical protein